MDRYYVPPPPRHDAFRPEEFLEALAKTKKVAAACQAIKCARSTAYKWKQDEPAFSDRWDEILQARTDELEEVVHSLAINGYEEPVFYEGVECGYKRKWPQALQMFLLEAWRPERYGRRQELNITADKAEEFVAAIGAMRSTVPQPTNGQPAE